MKRGTASGVAEVRGKSGGSSRTCVARIDVARAQRRGFPEVVYCPGKTLEQIEDIARVIIAHRQTVLLTRADEAIYARIRAVDNRARYYPLARVVAVCSVSPSRRGLIAVLSAGTGDIAVAEEAAVTAELMGSRVERVYDVGVAGLHRLLAQRRVLRRARVCVVVAGMEGALVSVVSGLVAVPVVGVPTSIGYGASFSGVAALLTMLNSCSPGVSVVNIDNGFGAGYLAHQINVPLADGRKHQSIAVAARR